jgi:K(+)-stimulated pyrophosphate-energized sodium pump
MKIATKTNVRTTQAARTSLPGIESFFWRRNRMGLGVAVSGTWINRIFYFLFHFYEWVWTNSEDMTLSLRH